MPFKTRYYWTCKFVQNHLTRFKLIISFNYLSKHRCKDIFFDYSTASAIAVHFYNYPYILFYQVCANTHWEIPVEIPQYCGSQFCYSRRLHSNCDLQTQRNKKNSNSDAHVVLLGSHDGDVVGPPDIDFSKSIQQGKVAGKLSL